MIDISLPFNQKLIKLRRSRGFTQAGLARSLYMARQTYVDLESGKVQPRLDRLQDLSRLLGVPVTTWLPDGDKPCLAGVPTADLMNELSSRIPG